MRSSNPDYETSLITFGPISTELSLSWGKHLIYQPNYAAIGGEEKEYIS